MDTDHCPKCGEKAVIEGRIPTRWEHRFEPKGQRFFGFRVRGFAPLCSKHFRACLACGLVWTHMNPEDLRRFIDDHGTAETKLKLAPFRKVPPEQDLI